MPQQRVHLEPGVLVNIVDITLYQDGIKITFADSPDGTERSAEHRGSYYLANDTAKKLVSMLTRVYGTRTGINADENPRTQER